MRRYLRAILNAWRASHDRRQPEPATERRPVPFSPHDRG